MSFEVIESLPAIAEHSDSSLAFALDEEGMLTVVFEAHRDFLSTPRQFIEIEVIVAADSSVCTGGLMLDDTQWTTLEMLPYACYRVGSSSQADDPVISEPTHFAFYSPKRVLEFTATSVVLKKTHYHRTSCRAVLSAALAATEN